MKKAGLRLDRDLGATPPAERAGEVEQVIVPGGFGFAEVAFFHRASRTLVLTDLVLNLAPAKLPRLARPLARLIGTTAPDGRAPVYLRLVIKLRHEQAARAAARLVAWDPERVIFAHGCWFERGRCRRPAALPRVAAARLSRRASRPPESPHGPQVAQVPAKVLPCPAREGAR